MSNATTAAATAPAAATPGDAVGPAEIGTMLREVRQNRGLALADVATELRIRAPYLQAIEEGDLAALPGTAYASGFVRTYGEYLGLDGEDLIARYRATGAVGEGQSDLYLPSPVEEGRLPTGAIFLVAVVLAAVVYGGWYYLSSDGRDPVEQVAALPDRLAKLVGGDGAPGGTATEASASENQPKAENASSNAASAAPAATPAAAETSAAPVIAPAVPQSLPAPAISMPRIDQDAPRPAAASEAAPSTENQPALDEVRRSLPLNTERGAAAEPAPPSAAVPPQSDIPRPADSVTTPPSDTSAQSAPATPTTTPTETPAPASTTAPAAAAPSTAAAASEAASVAASESAATATPAAAPTETVVAAVPPPTPRPAPAPATPEPATETAAATPATTAQPEAEPAPARPAPSPVRSRIILRATADSFVEVGRNGEEPLFSQVMRAGEVFAVPPGSNLVLMTGNAGALQILVDGRRIAPLGPDGEVRRGVALDPDGLLRAGRPPQ